MHGERGRVLQAALAAITPDQRHAIVMFDVEGYDYAEIAELTGVSLGTVKSRIHRGRLALRDRLEGSHGPVPRGGRLMPHPSPPSAAHAAHDPLLVAAYAAGDATGAELETATALVAACAACAALHHDLRAIAAALPAMPAPRPTRRLPPHARAGGLAPPRRLAPAPRPVRRARASPSPPAGLRARRPGHRRDPPRRSPASPWAARRRGRRRKPSADARPGRTGAGRQCAAPRRCLRRTDAPRRPCGRPRRERLQARGAHRRPTRPRPGMSGRQARPPTAHGRRSLAGRSLRLGRRGVGARPGASR